MKTALSSLPASPSWPLATELRRKALEIAAILAMASREMSFLEHLEELRRRLIWSVVFIAAAFALCWVFAGDLYDIASAPIRSNPAVTLSISRPQDIFSLYVKVTTDPGNMLIIAAPMVVLYVVGIGVAWIFGRRRQPTA